MILQTENFYIALFNSFLLLDVFMFFHGNNLCVDCHDSMSCLPVLHCMNIMYVGQLWCHCRSVIGYVVHDY